jgi:hypothetical protein
MGLFSVVLSIFAFIFDKNYSFTGLFEKIKGIVKASVFAYIIKTATTVVTTSTFFVTHYYIIIGVFVALSFVFVAIASCFQPQLTSLRVHFGYQEDPALVAARLQATQDNEKADASSAYWLTVGSYVAAVASGAGIALTIAAAIVDTTPDKLKPKEIT